MGSFGVSLPVLALNTAFLGQPTRLGKRTIRAAQVLSTSAVGIKFGDPVVIIPGTAGTGDTIMSVADYIAGGGTFTADLFAGIALREVKTQLAYTTLATIPATLVGLYAPGDMAEFMEEGSIGINVTYGTGGANGTAPVSQGTVYVRVATTVAHPNSPIGSICAAADGAGGVDTVALTGVKFRTGIIDGNHVAEITMLNRVAA